MFSHVSPDQNFVRLTDHKYIYRQTLYELVEGTIFNRLYFMEKICFTLGLNKSAVIIHRILPNMMEPVKSRDISENQLNLKTKHQNRNFYLNLFDPIQAYCLQL